MVKKFNLLAYIVIAAGVASYFIRHGFISFLPIEVRSEFLMKFDFIKFFQIGDQTAFFFSVGLMSCGLAVLLFNYLHDEHDQSTSDSYLIDEKKILTSVLAYRPASNKENIENGKKLNR